jgi:hypothetical protein
MEGAWVEPPEERTYQFDPIFTKIFSVGNLPATVDWLWLTVLQDPSISHVEQGKRANIYYNLDLATMLDPAFMAAYVDGAALLAVVRNDGVGARDLLLRGESFLEKELPTYPEEFRNRFWPNSWLVPMQLAYTDMFEVGDLPGAGKAYAQAAKIPGVPLHVQSFSDKLATREGSFEIGRRILKSLHDNSIDPDLKERYARQQQSLEVAYYLFQVESAYDKYAGKHAGELDPARWESFLHQAGRSAIDPWGGTVSLGPDGHVNTTTEHEKVLGIE